MADNCRETHILTRLRRLRRAMRSSNLDAFLATDPQDVSYLSGFTGHDSFLLVTRRSAVLITDSRYTEQAQRQCPRLTVVQRKGPMAPAVAERAKRASIGRIGFEPAALSLAAYKHLAKSLGRGVLAPSPGILRRLRICKDTSEISALRRAINVAERAFLDLLTQLNAGMTEREAAARLDFLMKLRGASQPAFTTIIACGANSSMPHAQPGNARIKPNQPILIDFGANVAGYSSDLTRVVFLDSIPQSLRTVYDTVRDAAQAGIRAVKPGVPAKKVDQAARAVIEKAGFGDYFGHGLGHGIGRDVHEAPLISPSSKDVLEEGMVFTIEPGIYLPKRGGIRIENDVLVTKNGYRVLSALPDDANWAIIRTRKKNAGK